MARASFNINHVAFHFDIHKTIAYRIINRFVQIKLVGDRLRSGRQKKLPEERFIQIISRRMRFLTANPLCITSGNCLGSVHWNTWTMFKILTFCPFEKPFMTGTAPHTNEILQYLVFDKIVYSTLYQETYLLLPILRIGTRPRWHNQRDPNYLRIPAEWKTSGRNLR